MRVGIVGCGRISAFHIRPLRKRFGADAIAVADPNVEAAGAVSERWGISRAYPGLEAMLEDHVPDVVHVLTPPRTHADITIRALEAGSHVLVEKPMAMGVREADAMLAAARRAGRTLCVGHNFVWQPLVQRVVGLVESGRVGKLLHVDVRYAFDLARLGPGGAGHDAESEDWRGRLPAGVLFDLFPHPASILLRLIGKAGATRAVVGRHAILPDGGPDELAAVVEGENATGSLSVSLGTRPDSLEVAVYGTAMTVLLNGSNMTLVVRKHRDLPKAVYRVLDSLGHASQLVWGTARNSLGVALGRMPAPGDPGVLIDRLYDSIERGTPVPVPGDEAAEVVRMAERIWNDGEGLANARPLAAEIRLAPSLGRQA